MWWLRSPGGYDESAAYVELDGDTYYGGVSYDEFVVRPALWVNF